MNGYRRIQTEVLWHLIVEVIHPDAIPSLDEAVVELTGEVEAVETPDLDDIPDIDSDEDDIVLFYSNARQHLDLLRITRLLKQGHMILVLRMTSIIRHRGYGYMGMMR